MNFDDLGEVRVQLWDLDFVNRKEVDDYLAVMDRPPGYPWARAKSTGT